MKPVEMAFTGKRLVLPTIFLWLLISIGIAMVIDTRACCSEIVYNRISGIFIILATGPLGLAVSYLLLKRMINPVPGLIIDNKGITDSSSLSSVGFVSWENIVGMVTKRPTAGTYTIAVLVNNAEEIINKQRGFGKLVAKLNLRGFKSPVHISPMLLKGKSGEIYKEIKTWMLEKGKVVEDA